MKFSTLLALFGAIEAAKICPCDQAVPEYSAPCEQTCDNFDFSATRGSAGRLSGALNAAGRMAGASREGTYGTLGSENAASNTQIGARNIVIPDKNTVTDQAKVSEAVSKGNNKEQTCQVAQRKFTIGGEITVTEKYSDSLKAENVQNKCGEGASQTRSRTQVLNNMPCGASSIPVTAQCGAPCSCSRS